MKLKSEREKRIFRMGCAVGKKRSQHKKQSTKHEVRKRKAFVDDFIYTDNGRISGHYTVDGFFEPD